MSEWYGLLEGCDADFGNGKLIVDVVTEEGDPVPPEVDLDSIVDAFDLGYVDPAVDANKVWIDPLCHLEWADNGRENMESATAGYPDFRGDENVAGRRVPGQPLPGG